MTRLSVGLPFTRKQEQEADDIALRLMARACYDPRASAELHKAMNKDPGGRFRFFTKHGINSERMHRLRYDSTQWQGYSEVYACSTSLCQ